MFYVNRPPPPEPVPKPPPGGVTEQWPQTVLPVVRQAPEAETTVLPVARAMQQNGAPGPYAVMKKFTDNLGGAYQAHHILEQKFARLFGLGNADKLPAVILSDAEHKAMTALLKEKTAGIESAERLWEVYQDVYKTHPAWLDAIKSYFAKAK
jgi:hypothetical protein